MTNGKRIHSVTIKRMLDQDPDTSHLGEYSTRPSSQFSIDRAHDLDCICQTYNKPTGEGLRVLEAAQQYLCDSLNELQANAAQQYIPFELVEWYDDGDTFIHDFLEGDEELCLGSCRGSWNNREYRYFNPSFNYVDDKGHAKDEDPKAVIAYTKQDFERMESLNNNNWCYVGIGAEAEYYVSTPADDSTGKHGTFLLQKITSGGLWGIESDSDRSYFESVEQEELAELRSQLKAIGFSSRAISTAFKTIERKEA